MQRQTDTEMTNEIRMIIGLNGDGTRNGNGLLGDVRILKKDVNSINKNIIGIVGDIKKHPEEMAEIKIDMAEIRNDIKEIKIALNDKIGMKSIAKVQKITVGIAAFIGAAIAIIGYILFIAGKISL